MISWSICASMITPRRLHGATVFRNFIYVFGGCCNDPIWFTCKAEKYDVGKNYWSSVPDMPLSGAVTAITLDDTYIVILVHGKGVLRFDPVTQTYIVLGKFPLVDLHSFCATTVGSKVIICGGTSDGKLTKNCYSFDSRLVAEERLVWTKECDLPIAVRRSVVLSTRSRDTERSSIL